MNQVISLRKDVDRFEFLSSSGHLVKLVLDTGGRQRFVLSCGDFGMTSSLFELKIYSNTFDDCEDNLHWITNSSNSSNINISEDAFKFLSQNDFTKRYCNHGHYKDSFS